MEVVELLSCLGCGRIYDQWSMIPHALRCKRNRFAEITPTWRNKLYWLLNNPRHVIALYIKDFRESFSEKRG